MKRNSITGEPIRNCRFRQAGLCGICVFTQYIRTIRMSNVSLIKTLVSGQGGGGTSVSIAYLYKRSSSQFFVNSNLISPVELFHHCVERLLSETPFAKFVSRSAENIRRKSRSKSFPRQIRCEPTYSVPQRLFFDLLAYII